MHRILRSVLFLTVFLLLHAISNNLMAQSTLARNISIHVKDQRLGTVLKTIEERGKFYFSYNSNIVKVDSLVTLDADNWTVKEVLDRMLLKRFEYKETREFVILRYAPLQLSLTTDKSVTVGDEYIISGFVADEQSGRKLENASVYEKNLLQSAITNASGYFELRMKNDGGQVRITISKELYKDTTITFLNDVVVTNRPERSVFSYAADGDYEDIANTSLGRLFLSTKQQVEALNLRGLIASAPFQASAIPNVSTHGALNGQIVNTVSLNAIGGYSAGVDGFELGLIFNLDKGDVRSVQVAGIFNVVGGSVSGVQFGGLYNNVLGSVSGVQLALLHNSVKRDMNGVQLSLYNHVRGRVSGMQIGPVGNIADRKFRGIQLGLFNYARNSAGLQIGLVNIADTTSGFSLGLINYARRGYHKIGLTANETLNANISLKSGSQNFYTIYTGGMRVNDKSRIYGFGVGFGNVMNMGKHLAFNPELTSRYLYQGSWDYRNLLTRLDANLNFKLGKYVTLLAGPALNYYYSNQQTAVNGYAMAQNLQHNLNWGGGNHSWWLGWNVGINFF